MTGKNVGAVVIGRNEGERLRTCLQSLTGQVEELVYVDSGSTDNSLQIAYELGVSVVNLDMNIPFTAARARNNGFIFLMDSNSEIKFVQFVDGDCEVIEGWIDEAINCMNENEQTAVVCGRRRERFPDKSVYNMLCDIEWDTPLGESLACGGDALIRASALQQINGYNASLIAGEEPEMCLRLRRNKWKVIRIAADMTWHDAAMFRFSQWWKRAVRAGHAYAEGAWLHGDSPERHWVRDVRSNWFWGLSFPVLMIMAVLWPVSSFLMLFYPLQAVRIFRHASLKLPKQDRQIYALSCLFAKLPLMLGQMKFHINRILGKKSTLIEYK